MFPTGVGMNRRDQGWRVIAGGVPHGRGDEPDLHHGLRGYATVFPTGVGMNRCAGWSKALSMCVPHGRGDEPRDVVAQMLQQACSPRAWG